MVTVYELQGMVWTGASMEVDEFQGWPSDWTTDVPPDLNQGQIAVWAGGTWLVTTPDQFTPPKPVPDRVSQMQLSLALLHFGLLDAVEAAVLAAGPVVRLYWAKVSEIHRDHIVVAQLAYALSKTSKEIDDVFIFAATIS